MSLKKILTTASLILVASSSMGQINFSQEFAGYSWTKLNGFNPHFGAVDMAYLPDGTILVAQHTGIVTRWNGNGGYLGEVLNIRDEVWSNGDAGLTSILLDPDFPETPSMYLMYAVETQTDPDLYDQVIERFGRITKYDLKPDFTGVIPESRQILLGETWSEGILLESMFHATNSMEWGDDGTLLFTAGDSADFGYTPTTGVNIYGPGKFDQSLNIRSMRAQTLDNYNAKVSRIDRNTGLGLPTNPFYDPSAPDSPRSKIWAYGLRNPWRFSVRQGTGDHTSFGKGPGVLWIGDVGLDTYEELNVTSKEGGENFGWPFYEGAISPLNPNTYNGPIPWVPVEETTTFSLAFAHPGLPNKSYPENFTSDYRNSSITAGFFYDYKLQDNYNPSTPAPYTPILDGKYMFAEWSHKYLFLTDVDPLNQPGKVTKMAEGPIQESFEGIVDLSYNPYDGKIYALTYWRLVRLDYDPNGGPPLTSLKVTPDIGPLPLTVTLDASESLDPAGTSLSYAWDFGDGTTHTSSEPVIQHTFTENQNYDIIVTASTPDDRASSTTVTVYPGNIPPQATILLPTIDTTYPADGTPVVINYSGSVNDPDGTVPEAKFRVALRHNDHRHELQETDGLEGSIEIRHEEENTWYLFELFATDDRGYTIKVDREIFREGPPSSVINWSLYE